MSKSRLEEIKRTQYQIMEISKTNMQADFNFLLNYINEQSNRINILENSNLLNQERFEKDIKRYREEIERVINYVDSGKVITAPSHVSKILKEVMEELK